MVRKQVEDAANGEECVAFALRQVHGSWSTLVQDDPLLLSVLLSDHGKARVVECLDVAADLPLAHPETGGELLDTGPPPSPAEMVSQFQ